MKADCPFRDGYCLAGLCGFCNPRSSSTWVAPAHGRWAGWRSAVRSPAQTPAENVPEFVKRQLA